MADDIRRRAACDRCHSQKIRCPKRPGQQVCDRCTKSGAPCIFSPFRQKKPVPENTSTPEAMTAQTWSSETPSSSEGGEDSMARKRKRLDTGISLAGSSQIQNPSSVPMPEWDAFDPTLTAAAANVDWTNAFPGSGDFAINGMLDDLSYFDQGMNSTMGLGSPPLLTQDEDCCFKAMLPVDSRRHANLNRAFTHASNLVIRSDAAIAERETYGLGLASNLWSDSEVVQLESVSTCIRQLSELSINLVEHQASIPPVSIHDKVYSNDTERWTQNAKDYSKFKLEDTFTFTQNLIEIYPSFLEIFISSSRSSSESSSPASMVYNTSPESSSSSENRSTSPSRGVSKPKLDHSAILLIISCHLRLIDIYEELFRHMKVCIDQKGFASSPNQAMVNSPQLRIGTYYPPKSVAIPMQMLMLIQIASQLFHYATDLWTEIQAAKKALKDVQDDNIALSQAAAENVKNRASKMSTELGSMRTEMLHWGC